MARPTLHVYRTADIGPALKDLRLSEGVSQTDTAEAIGIHQSHIGTYERNKVVPSGARMIDFMDAHNYVLTFLPKELARQAPVTRADADLRMLLNRLAR